MGELAHYHRLDPCWSAWRLSGNAIEESLCLAPARSDVSDCQRFGPLRGRAVATALRGEARVPLSKGARGLLSAPHCALVEAGADRRTGAVGRAYSGLLAFRLDHRRGPGRAPHARGCRTLLLPVRNAHYLRRGSRGGAASVRTAAPDAAANFHRYGSLRRGGVCEHEVFDEVLRAWASRSLCLLLLGGRAIVTAPFLVCAACTCLKIRLPIMATITHSMLLLPSDSFDRVVVLWKGQGTTLIFR